MKLSELSPAAGSVRESKRKGRGPGTGNGKTGGRGHKGLGQRSGGSSRRGFEGGQMPLVRRVPKRGFVNIFKVSYEPVNVSTLESFNAGDVIDAAALLERGLMKSSKNGLKVLGNGELTKSLTVKAAAFSESARRKIEAAGGKAEVV